MKVVAAKFSELAVKVSLPKTHKKTNNLLSLSQKSTRWKLSDLA